MIKTSQNPAASSAVEIPFLSDVTEYDRLLDQYSVMCFSVIDPRIDGTTTHQTPISPCFATRAQAEHFKSQKQADYPNCFIAAFENYFTAEDEESRLELLTQVIGVDQGGLPRLGEFWVRSFIVVQGGETNPDRNSPISPCFPSKEQANAFQALHRAQYPQSQILTQDYAADDDLSRWRWIAKLFPYHSINISRPIAQDIEFPAAMICFTVIHEGDNAKSHLPIGPYFRTQAEAECFQAEIHAQYPHCRIAQQSFVPEDEEDREALLEQLFGQEA
jgi:hypothetical protein